MIIQGKIWGHTSPLFNKNNVEIHRLVGKKGGFCSKHKHVHKYNMFFVEKGKISVSVWKDYGLIDETIIKNNESVIVSPGEFHKFKIIEEGSIVYEIYWTQICENDIERDTQGGVDG